MTWTLHLYAYQRLTKRSIACKQNHRGSNHTTFFHIFLFIYHKIQITIKQDSYTKANESSEEAQKETTGFIDIGLPQSKTYFPLGLERSIIAISNNRIQNGRYIASRVQFTTEIICFELGTAF